MKRTPLRKRNPKRLQRLRLKQFGPPGYQEKITGMRCCVCGAHPPSDPHHVRTKGAGGTFQHLVPLCRFCHDLFHTLGRKTFQTRFRIDLEEVAQGIAERLKGEG